MCLFVAILFSDHTLDQLFAACRRLRDCAGRGSFTRRENLHLTLAFIGESGREDELCRVLEKLEGEPFPLWVEGFGTFRREGGDICWLGLRRSEALLALHRQLSEGLERAGFPVERRPFRPHLTLGRQVLLPRGFDPRRFGGELPKITERVEAVSLMKSERIDGRLTYTELYRYTLGGARP